MQTDMQTALPVRRGFWLPALAAVACVAASGGCFKTAVVVVDGGTVDTTAGSGGRSPASGTGGLGGTGAPAGTGGGVVGAGSGGMTITGSGGAAAGSGGAPAAGTGGGASGGSGGAAAGAGGAPPGSGGAPATGAGGAVTGTGGGVVSGSGGALAGSGGAVGGTGGAGTGGAGTGGSGGMPIASVCGNGLKETGEACDAGAANGVFYGDGSGCSATCTREPGCRDATGRNRACDVTCGNGHVEPGEACDDGNVAAGDGCSTTCTVEGGFTCTSQQVSDTVPCAGVSGQYCLRLPMVLRDFKDETQTGGHPDFFYSGATDGLGKVTRWCIGNAAGPARGFDSTPRSWDMAQPDLVNGKPVFNSARAGGLGYYCQFTDWSSDGNGGRVPGYTLAQSPLRDQVASPNPPGSVTTTEGHPTWHGVVPLVTSAASFGQWFTDSSYSTRSATTLELAMAAPGEYQYASPPGAVGGFYPVDPPGAAPAGTVKVVGGTLEPLLCSLWPYWFPAAFRPPAQLTDCTGDQFLFPPDVSPAYPLGTWVVRLPGSYHNYWFTTESRLQFVYDGAQALLMQFFVDDDLLVFVNGKLVIDLGGIHEAILAEAGISGLTGTASITEGGESFNGAHVGVCPGGIDPRTGLANAQPADCRTRSVDLGMTPGRVYEMAIFHAERGPTGSAFRVRLSGSFSRTRSSCTPAR